MLTINTITRCGRPFLNVLLANENDFSAQVEYHRFYRSHDITLHVSFHWYDKCRDEKLEQVTVMITWSGNATIGRKTISGLNHIMWHQLQIMSSIRLMLICNCYMTSHYDTHNLIWQKKYGFYLNKKILSTLPLRPGRNHAEVLCDDFMGNLLVLFSTMCNSVKEPCNIKSFNISTAYDIWVSRYRPSNLMLATDSALALVFINFLWAV